MNLHLQDRRELLSGFQPAFLDRRTGETHLSVDSHGDLCDDHRFNGLPDHWIVDRDAEGTALSLHPDIIAGYWRVSNFFDLSFANSIIADA